MHPLVFQHTPFAWLTDRLSPVSGMFAAFLLFTACGGVSPVQVEESAAESVEVPASFQKPEEPLAPCKTYVNRTRGHPISTLIRQVETPKEAAAFVADMCYIKDDDLYGYNHWASMLQTHYNDGYGDCDDIAIMALALLSDDMKKMRVLSMSKEIEENGEKKLFWHAVALYEKDGKYGSIGNKDSYQPAKYDTLAELVDAIDGFTGYRVYDLTDNRRLLLTSDVANLKEFGRKIESYDPK